MLRTTGLELTNLFNSCSSWKVLKGNRSSSRQARREVAKISESCSESVFANSGSSNMPVSESGKHQGYVLGCRFKAEHVPIKKRRFLFRSPSPPPKIPSPDNEENPNLIKSQDDRVQSAVVQPATPKTELGNVSGDGTDFQCNYPKKVNEKLKRNEGFSGISILAAAACSNSLGREFGHAEDNPAVEEPSIHARRVEALTNNEAQSSSKGLARDGFENTPDISIGGTSSCVTTALVGELAATLTSEYASEKASDVEKRIKDPSCGDGAPSVSSDISSMKDEDTIGNQKLHSRDDRLHWDLNVVMDAWEPLFDYQDANNYDHISQGSGFASRYDANRKCAEASDLLSEPENSPCDDKMMLLPCEPRKLVNQTSPGNTEVIGDCDHENHPVRMCQKSASSECRKVPSSLVDDSNSSPPLPSSYVHENPPFLKPLAFKRHADLEPICEDSNSDVHAPLFTGLKNSGPSVPDTKCTVVSVGAVVAKHTNVAAVDSLVRPNVIPTPDFENKDTPKSELSDKCFNDKRQCLKDDGNDAQIYMAFQVKDNDPLEKIEKETDDPQMSNSMHELSKVKNNDPLEKIEKETDDPQMSKSMHELSKVTKADHDDFSMNASDQAVTDVQVSIKEVTVSSAEHLEQFISDAPFDPHPLSRIEVEGELQEDYDSQYEDGELREPTEPVCEEYDAIAGEALHVDYRVQNSRSSVSVADHHVLESVHVRKTKHRDAGNADGISSVSGVGEELCAKSNRPITHDKDHGRDANLLKSFCSGDEKMEGPAPDELPESNKISSAAVVGVRDDCDGVRIHHANRSTDSEGIDTRPGSGLYRRGLVSCIEGPVSHDMSFRENQRGNRWESGSNYAKSSERVRYIQSQPRFRQFNSWDGSSDSRRGIKHSDSPTYHSLVKPDDDDTTMKDDRDGTLNAVSRSSHRLTNSASIADGDATENFHLGPKLDGDPGSDRLMSRGRFLRHGTQMDHRAGRGRNHGLSSDDTFQSSLKYRCSLSRRDRSVSPNEKRGYPFAHQSHGRSTSRSRTRSPNPRLSPRGRSGDGNCGGVYLRHRSRSPNFRSEARMLRMRSPPRHQFVTDHMTEFSPFQRDRGSPPSSRWTSGRKDEVGHFNYKQRAMLDGSPGRFHLRDNRKNFLDSARNSKPDVYYRLNTGRISDMNVTGRASRLEGNYENRWRQFGPNHPARRGYDESIAKRLHHDDGNDDVGFVSTNRDVPEFHGRRVRGVDDQNEDMPKRFRGNATCMYERDEKFSSNSKPFRFDGMDSSRTLKPEESYRSMNLGRFNEVDRAARGHRYVDSYDDRRRYYGSVDLARRSEMEGIGRRLSHDVGDDLPVSRSSCSDAAADCRGRNARGIDGRGDVLPRRQREEQQLDFSGQEKKLSDTSMSTNVQVPAESESVKGNSPS